MIVTHIIARHAGWLHLVLGEGSSELTPLATWDDEDQPTRTAIEVVVGLEATRRMIAEALSRWTPADLEKEFQD